MKEASSRDCTGYTLLEMLAVMGMLALILSLSLATHPLRIQRSLDSLSVEIAAVLKSAAIRAVSQNAEVTLVVDPATRSISTSSSDEGVRLGENIELVMVTARSEVMEGRGRIRFYPDGTTTGGTVQLRRGSRSISVHVNWLTGQIRREAGVAR